MPVGICNALQMFCIYLHLIYWTVRVNNFIPSMFTEAYNDIDAKQTSFLAMTGGTTYFICQWFIYLPHKRTIYAVLC